MIECVKCVNSTDNPTITIDSEGLCNICSLYKRRFKLSHILSQLDFFLSLKNEKVMVGLSGGKDSTAALYLTLKMGFKPITFTFDIGYYPQHIFPRAEKISQYFDVPHEKIDIRKYINDSDRACYSLTMDLYESNNPNFRELYKLNREAYSVKSEVKMPFVRSCQICRKVVIKAYYEEALKHNAKAVILGMNEWAGLSGNNFSAVRKLKPYPNRPAVYIVHLPFLLQHDICRTSEILIELGWKAPEGEVLIETNGNSCLFAKATEEKARKLLSFHPDTTRLAREVTAGFINKSQAKKALEKRHESNINLKELLTNACIIT